MTDQSELLANISVALGIALAGGWVATKLRLSPIVGYVVAGVIVSPFTPGFTADADALRLLADVGIVLLLFAIGVQLSVEQLLGVGWPIAFVTILQVAVVMATVAAGGSALGWSRDETLYAGAAAAISSSAVLIKILDARGDQSSGHGKAAVAWSVVQDLSAVVIIAVLGTVAGSGRGSSAWEAAATAAIAVGFVLVVMVLGLRLMPRVLNLVADVGSRELFFLAIAFLAIATALMSEYAGLSLAMGAFLAGIIVSESDLSHRVLSELLPTRDVFAVLFFVSTGMLIDPSVVRSEWITVLATIAGITVAKPVVSAALLIATGARTSVAVLAAAVLLPAGEFSFLIARSGLKDGALSDGFFGAILAATVVSIVVSPGIVEGAYRWVERDRRPVRAEAAAATSRLGRRAIVCGYSRVGQLVASILSPRFDVWVVEDDRGLCREARARDLHVIEGNPGSHQVLERMHLHDARVLILTMRDALSARLVAERACDINPHLEVVGLAPVLGDVAKLQRSGIKVSIVAEDEGAYELARYGLHRFGIDSAQAAAIIQRARDTRVSRAHSYRTSACTL